MAFRQQGKSYSCGAAALRRRWAHFKQGDGEEDPHYFFIAVRPRVRQPHPRGIVDSDVVLGLRRREELRGGWGRYLQDLISIFGRRPSRTRVSYPAGRFITRNAPLLAETLFSWDGNTPKKFYRTETRNLAIVARASGMRTRPRDEKRSLVSLACVLNREALKPT